MIATEGTSTHYRAMSTPWDEDGGFAWERREAGYTWEEIGGELGCPAHVAKDLGERHQALVAAEIMRNQIPLFELPEEG